jgi:hypothetical protein
MLRKILAVVLAVGIVLTLCSCGLVRMVTQSIFSDGSDTHAGTEETHNSVVQAPRKGSAEYEVWEEIPEPKLPEEALTPSEAAGSEIAVLLAQMGSYQVKEKRSDRWVMEVTAPDMRKVFSKAQKDLNANGSIPVEEYDAAMEQLMESVCAQLRSGNVSYVTREVTVKVSGGEPVLDEAFYDALYGGMLSMLTEAYEAYAGGAAQ